MNIDQVLNAHGLGAGVSKGSIIPVEKTSVGKPAVKYVTPASSQFQVLGYDWDADGNMYVLRFNSNNLYIYLTKFLPDGTESTSWQLSTGNSAAKPFNFAMTATNIYFCFQGYLYKFTLDLSVAPTTTVLPNISGAPNINQSATVQWVGLAVDEANNCFYTIYNGDTYLRKFRLSDCVALWATNISQWSSGYWEQQITLNADKSAVFVSGRGISGSEQTMWRVSLAGVITHTLKVSNDGNSPNGRHGVNLTPDGNYLLYGDWYGTTSAQFLKINQANLAIAETWPYAYAHAAIQDKKGDLYFFSLDIGGNPGTIMEKYDSTRATKKYSVYGATSRRMALCKLNEKLGLLGYVNDSYGSYNTGVSSAVVAVKIL
ncbi:hypothetical protein P9302_12550 [Brevibacillus agri]|uniref:hypothetical protein n=1 Tax=Brevibacillus agri TaxID=51101 RepID=UPI002E1CB249|nr:hypothetical protein [Brevibacillus agri]